MMARVLVRGTARGEVLRLTADISFWGGIDPLSGRVMDARHPQFGTSVSGRILVLGQSIGSSSGSSILLEMLARGTHPAGIILGVADQVLTLGSIVGREMGLGHVPVLQLDEACFDALPQRLRMLDDGRLEACVQQP